MPKQPQLRPSGESRLRYLADRLEPRWQDVTGRPCASLIRFGGRWWRLDELVAPADSVERAADVELDR
jgi:hypothetical protein